MPLQLVIGPLRNAHFVVLMNVTSLGDSQRVWRYVVNVAVLERSNRRRYEVYADDVPAGLLSYRLAGDRLCLIHTEIESPYEGNGLGSVLVKHVMDEARQRQHTVVAYCPYVRGWIDSHTEYSDLVVAD
jgi:predicted GNAT family acetyltransferase